MINLLVNKTEESAGLVRARQLSKKLTTLVLVVYILGSAGFLGWTMYQSAKTVRVSNELTQLSSEVAALATEEVFVRKLSTKATEVVDFLAARPEMVTMADILIKADVTTIGWVFDVNTGLQKVSAKGANSAEINNFVDYMNKYYSEVKLEKLAYTQLDGWVGTVTVRGIKK